MEGNPAAMAAILKSLGKLVLSSKLINSASKGAARVIQAARSQGGDGPLVVPPSSPALPNGAPDPVSVEPSFSRTETVQSVARRTGSMPIRSDRVLFAAQLGKLMEERAQLQPLMGLFTGDPVSYCLSTVPRYAIDDSGRLRSRYWYAQRALEGGLFDSLKRLGKRLAPVAAKIAPVVSKVVSSIGGPIGGIASKAITALGNAASKAAGAASEASLEAAGSAEEKVTPAPVQEKVLIGPDGQRAAAPDVTASELRVLEGPAPVAVFGDATLIARLLPSEDRLIARGVSSAVLSPGISLAEAQGLPGDATIMQGGIGDFLKTAAQKVKQGVASLISDSKGDAVAAEQVASDAATAAAASGGSSPVAKLLEQVGAPKVASAVPTETTVSGQPVITPEQQQALDRGQKTAIPTDSAAQRAADAYSAFAHAVMMRDYPTWDVPALDRRFGKDSIAVGDNLIASIPAEAVNELLARALTQWRESPRSAAVDAVHAVLAETTLMALLRDAADIATKDKIQSFLRTLVALSPAVFTDEEIDDLLARQRLGELSVEEAEALGAAAAQGALALMAYTVPGVFELKSEKTRYWYPELVRLAEAVNSMAGATTMQEQASNIALATQSIRTINDAARQDNRFALPQGATSESTSVTTIADNVTAEEQDAWRANKSWLSRVASMASSESLMKVLTALGFAASTASLLTTLLKKDAESFPKADSEAHPAAPSVPVMLLN
jgi:hypothetical protein